MKSIYNITSMWIEEASELELTDKNQLDIRLRGETKHYKQIIFSFNPISVTHWLKSEYFDVKKPDSTTLHTTYKDNKYLDEAAIKVLEGFKETDPYYYMVYALGEWGVLGKTVFDAQKVTNRIMQLREEKKGTVGRMETDGGKYRFVPDVNGLWTVYRHPEDERKYVAGIDVAEGNEHGDWDSAQILDATTYEQVAVFHGHVDVDKYAEEVIKGGHYFNTALLTPEVNFNPGFCLNLERMGYPKIYLRQMSDSVTHGVQMKYGFRTDKYNRQSIISDLVEFVRDHVDLLNDITTLEEMLTFIRDEKGKPQAQDGKHDDTVLALAIAIHAAMSGQGGRFVEKVKKLDIEKLPLDCQADLDRCKNEQERQYLLKRWGYV
jgi:phage terminase large subunit